MNSIDMIGIAVILGFFLDLLFGDPSFLYHPIRLIGNVIHVLDLKFRKSFGKEKANQNIAGACLVFFVLLFTYLFFGGILALASFVSQYLLWAIEVFFCFQILAAHSLKKESMKVYHALLLDQKQGQDTKNKQQSYPNAKKALSMIVGRDTKDLNEEGIIKATVETIAENTSDGVIAPLFYMCIGGPLLGFLYKAINTMDSMIGYKNEDYMHFGTAAAKLDDIVNYIPARISAYLMILATWFCKMDCKRAYKIYRRDRRNHESPNSAQTESVMAGALGVQLAGDAYYFGKLHKKPWIGDLTQEILPNDIKRANQLMYVTVYLSLIIFVGIRFLIWFLMGLFLK